MGEKKWIRIDKTAFKQAPGYLEAAHNSTGQAVSYLADFTNTLKDTGFTNRTGAYSSTISKVKNDVNAINSRIGVVAEQVDYIISAVDAYEKGFSYEEYGDVDLTEFDHTKSEEAVATMNQMVESKSFLSKAWDCVCDFFDWCADKIEEIAATFISAVSSIFFKLLEGLEDVAKTCAKAFGEFVCKHAEFFEKILGIKIDTESLMAKINAFISTDHVQSLYQKFIESDFGQWMTRNAADFANQLSYTIYVGENITIPTLSLIFSVVTANNGTYEVATLSGDIDATTLAILTELGIDPASVGFDISGITGASNINGSFEGKFGDSTYNYVDTASLGGAVNEFIEYSLEQVTDSYVGPTKELSINNNSMVGDRDVVVTLGDIPLSPSKQVQLATFKGQVKNLSSPSGTSILGENATVSIATFGLGTVASAAGTGALILGTKGLIGSKPSVLISSGGAGVSSEYSTESSIDDPKKLRQNITKKDDDDKDEDEDDKDPKNKKKPKVKITGTDAYVSIKTDDTSTVQTNVSSTQYTEDGVEGMSKFKPKFKSILDSTENLARLADGDTSGPHIHIENVGPEYVTMKEATGDKKLTGSRSYVFDSEEVDVQHPDYKWSTEEPTVTNPENAGDSKYNWTSETPTVTNGTVKSVTGKTTSVKSPNYNWTSEDAIVQSDSSKDSNMDARIAAREAASKAFEKDAVATPKVEVNSSEIEAIKQKAREVAAKEYEKNAVITGNEDTYALKESAREVAASEFERGATSTKSIANFGSKVSFNEELVQNNSSNKASYQLGNITYTSLAAIVAADDDDKYKV